MSARRSSPIQASLSDYPNLIIRPSIALFVALFVIGVISSRQVLASSVTSTLLIVIHLVPKDVDLRFSDGSKTTSADSLAVEAGGLHAKGQLSFKTGVFGEIEPPKAVRRALWDKNKNSKH